MNVKVANTISFAKDSLNLAKETVVNYSGRAITQLKHLPVTMHEDFRVACGVTATVTAVALIVGECFGEYVWKKVDGNDRKPASEVVKRLVFTATLASAYAGLSYATGFPQSKTVSALIVISFTAIRCLVSALDWQKISIGYLEGQDTLRREKTTVEQERNTLQQEKTNIEKERDDLRANEVNVQKMQADLQKRTDILEQQNQKVQEASDWLQKREKDFESTIQTLQQENDKLREFNSKFMQENSELTERNKKANSGYQKHCTNLQTQINALKQEKKELEAANEYLKEKHSPKRRLSVS